MKRKTFAASVFFFLGTCLIFAPIQADAQATKTYVTGWLGQPQLLEFGDAWLSGPIIHNRDFLYQWTLTSADPRLEGVSFNTYNANLDTRTFFPNGTIWGKFCSEQDGVVTWEGTWNGTYVDGIQTTHSVMHGVGPNEGLKATMTLVQVPFQPLFEVEAVILDPGGS